MAGALDDFLSKIKGLGDMSDFGGSRVNDLVDGVFGPSRSDLRPQIVWWLLRHGSHQPACGFEQRGDLVRWKECPVNGGPPARMPTVRVDFLQLAVSGKIEIKGTELVKWLGTKLSPNARSYLNALRKGPTV